MVTEARGDHCTGSSNTTIQYCIDCKIIPTKIRPNPAHTQAAFGKVLYPPFKSWAEEKDQRIHSACCQTESQPE